MDFLRELKIITTKTDPSCDKEGTKSKCQHSYIASKCSQVLQQKQSVMHNYCPIGWEMHREAEMKRSQHHLNKNPNKMLGYRKKELTQQSSQVLAERLKAEFTYMKAVSTLLREHKMHL